MAVSSQKLTAFLKAYSDSSFTNPHEVVLHEDPPDCMGNFTHMGAKYWGFETSRHRATQINSTQDGFIFNADAHHWFDIGLTHRSEVQTISVNTKWFTGNQVPEISIDLIDRTLDEHKTVISHASLKPDAIHDFSIDKIVATDCRVRCYHEGGIASVNLSGTPIEPLYDRPNLLADAQVSHTSNDHYGKPEDAVMGNRSVSHMVGWESARTGYGESTIFTLPEPAVIDTCIVDTYLHRLNPPLSCHLFGTSLTADKLEDAIHLLPRWKLVFPDGTETIPDNFQQFMLEKKYLPAHRQFEIKLHTEIESPWQPLISFAALQADTWHEFNKMESNSPFNTVYYMHYPNGGIHGIKLFGQYSQPM